MEPSANTDLIRYQPEEILQIIRASYRQQQQFDPLALKNFDLTYATTIADWQDVCDLVDNVQLGQYLNDYFGISIEQKVWSSVLEPADSATLKGFCHLIAKHAWKRIIRPIRLFGADCRTASIFRAIKDRLQKRGMDTKWLRPSSDIEALIQKNLVLFIEEINLISPNTLPPVDYRSNWLPRWSVWLFTGAMPQRAKFHGLNTVADLVRKIDSDI